MRLWLAAAVAGACAAWVSEVSAGDPEPEKAAGAAGHPWQPVRYKGRGYVYLEDVGRFYGLDHVRDGKRVSLRSDQVRLEALAGSRGLVLNGLNFHLSYPVLPWGDRVIVSNLDLANVIDPTLRPAALREPARLQTVIIDAAHGGLAAGFSGACGVEKEVTLDLARRLRHHLAEMPFEVRLTRDGDYDLSMEERLALAAAVPGESVFVSLHLGDGDPAARGLDVFTLPPPGTPGTYEDPEVSRRDDAFPPGNLNDRESLALAVAIQAEALRGNFRRGGLKRARFPELAGIGVPAVFCTAGYVSNSEDAALLGKPAYREQLAGALARGIRRYARVLEDGFEAHQARREQAPLVISGVKLFADQVRSEQGEKRRVRIDIRRQKAMTVDPLKLELQVFFFDLVNGRDLDLSTADPPAVEWISVLPDWKATDTEVVEVTYSLPAMTTEERKAFGQRFYHGFVCRLVYDGKLHDTHSDPANLHRALPHFTTVFP